MSIAGTIISTSPEHWWHWLIACVPFLTVVNGKVKIQPSQIIQYLIIAGFISVATAYITLSKLEVKFDMLESDIVENRQETKEGFAEVKRDIKEIRNVVFVPRGK